MPTLEEVLSKDMGLGDDPFEKTASQEDVGGDTELEKLATEVGLVSKEGDTDEESKEEPKKKEEESEQTKEASMSLELMYNDMFPGDVDIVGGSQEKTASMNKEAAEIEEAMGEVAFSSFAQCVDNHITKIAAEVLEGAATVDVEKKPDEEPAQTMASNKPADSEEAIDTEPQVTDMVSPQSGSEVSGDESAQETFEGEQHSELKTAAIRKYMLMAGLEE